ncbi:MAG TPA: hypothetical protein VKT70_04405 [Stellaceae bacterium]|nr:hypothetical protein [Stellaceae bacterium]
MRVIGDLLPHEKPMLLLDEVVSIDETSLKAAATIGPESLFLEAEGVPVHIGVEYMAQACAAFAGAKARGEGGEVVRGFLLGTRHFRAHAAYFRLHDRLLIEVRQSYADAALAAFAARIEVEGRLAAEAELTVYHPQHP